MLEHIERLIELRTRLDVPATWNVRRKRPELMGACLVLSVEFAEEYI